MDYHFRRIASRFVGQLRKLRTRSDAERLKARGDDGGRASGRADKSRPSTCYRRVVDRDLAGGPSA